MSSWDGSKHSNPLADSIGEHRMPLQLTDLAVIYQIDVNLLNGLDQTL